VVFVIASGTTLYGFFREARATGVPDTELPAPATEPAPKPGE